MGTISSVVALSTPISLFSLSAVQITHSLETQKEYLGIFAFTLLLACLCSYSIPDVHGGGEEKRLLCFILLATACFLPLFGYLVRISEQAYVRRQNATLGRYGDGGDGDDDHVDYSHVEHIHVEHTRIDHAHVDLGNCDSDSDGDGKECVVCGKEPCECISGGCPGGGDQIAAI